MGSGGQSGSGKAHPTRIGLRKVRWGARGQGKRGGLRLIYYWDVEEHRIYMLYVYSKTDTADLTQSQIRVLAKLVRETLS